MPRLPTDYSRTVMYKLCCLDQSINDIYIGQTTDFTKRKHKHKYCCCNENSKKYNSNVYQFIREHGGWDNWQMIQIEEYPCNNKREAEARETELMKELKSTLNSYQSFQTKEEKREYDNKYQRSDKYKEYLKIYRQTDTYKKSKKTDKIKEYKKQWEQKKALYLNELKCYNF